MANGPQWAIAVSGIGLPEEPALPSKPYGGMIWAEKALIKEALQRLNGYGEKGDII